MKKNIFKFDKIQFVDPLFYSLCFTSYLRNHCQAQGHKIFYYIFFWNFMVFIFIFRPMIWAVFCVLLEVRLTIFARGYPGGSVQLVEGIILSPLKCFGKYVKIDWTYIVYLLLDFLFCSIDVFAYFYINAALITIALQ